MLAFALIVVLPQLRESTIDEVISPEMIIDLEGDIPGQIGQLFMDALKKTD
jgi:hypothetical protein